MARRREETGLGEIGFVRLVLGPLKLGVEPLELGGALIDPAFQELVCGRERFLGLNGLRHVGIGRHDAAVRQARRAHLDHAVAREQAQPVRLIVIEQACHALGDEVLRISRPIGAAAGVETHDLVEANSVTQHGGRQIEELGEFAVPCGQRQVGVENGDALPRMVERMLKLVAARLDRGRSFVDELERRLAGDGPGPQQQ